MGTRCASVGLLLLLLQYPAGLTLNTARLAAYNLAVCINLAAYPARPTECCSALQNYNDFAAPDHLRLLDKENAIRPTVGQIITVEAACPACKQAGYTVPRFAWCVLFKFLCSRHPRVPFVLQLEFEAAVSDVP